jgi:hypothetical protein
MLDPTLPPLEYLFTCSEISLQDLEMASFDRGARRLKAAKEEWNEAVTQLANAEVARYFRDHRGQILETARKTLEQGVLEFPTARKRA